MSEFYDPPVSMSSAMDSIAGELRLPRGQQPTEAAIAVMCPVVYLVIDGE